jgi:hypothetical protein
MKGAAGGSAKDTGASSLQRPQSPHSLPREYIRWEIGIEQAPRGPYELLTTQGLTAGPQEFLSCNRTVGALHGSW